MLIRKPPDPDLFQTIQSDRFEITNCNWVEMVRLTYPWAKDPEILHAFAFNKKSYSLLGWALRMRIPNGRTFFAHAIRSKGVDETIGVHMMHLNRAGTARLMMGLTDPAWSGKGVFEEVRTSLLDHFSRSPRVVRFEGRVLARNASSLYIYKKLGFRLVGFERKVHRSPITGEHMDKVAFEYLAEDWRSDRGLASFDKTDATGQTRSQH